MPTTTYKNLTGKPLDKSQIHLAQTGQLDYCALISEYQLGIVERQGKRYRQEDRVAYRVIKDFFRHNAKPQDEIIQQAFDNAQANYGQFHDVGSTALLCLINTNSQQAKVCIKTAYVGDSVAFLALVDEDTVRLTRLNKQLHNPTPGNAEYQRVETIAKTNNIPGPSYYGVWRIGGLALSRSIGDQAIEPYGLIHEPDIDTIEFNFENDKHAYVIVACDGLTEPDAMIANDYQLVEAAILRHHQQALDDFAKALAQTSLDIGSYDNISVMVHKINMKDGDQYTVLSDDDCLALAVFDGHGGDQVSEQLRQYFLDGL